MTQKSLEALFGATAYMTVDRQWDRAAEEHDQLDPHAELHDDGYRPVAGEGTRFQIEISEDGHTCELQRGGDASRYWSESRLTGRRDDSSADLCYEFEKGLVAGGRLVLRVRDGAIQGEVTLYGSGRPVVESERGPVKIAH